MGGDVGVSCDGDEGCLELERRPSRLRLKMPPFVEYTEVLIPRKEFWRRGDASGRTGGRRDRRGGGGGQVDN